MTTGISVEHSSDPSGGQCRLKGVLDFTTARSALEQVEPLIREHRQLSIDLAGVTHSNSAALALLVELRASAHRAGHELAFSSVPDGIVQLSKLCQVDELLG